MHITADMDVTEEAAESEPAWTNAGKEVGLQIWRIVVSFHKLIEYSVCYIFLQLCIYRNLLSSVVVLTSSVLHDYIEVHCVSKTSPFLARDSIYAIARYMPSPVRLSVRPSVCLSVRHTGGSVKDV